MNVVLAADASDSKLRAHLEDARQDNRRISDENRDFLSELNERRSQLSKIDEIKRAERESLLAANQQVAKLKAQLQQASDGKVNKKTGGLRVSWPVFGPAATLEMRIADRIVLLSSPYPHICPFV